MITLTDTAADKVKELLKAEGADDLALRVAQLSFGIDPGDGGGIHARCFDYPAAPARSRVGSHRLGPCCCHRAGKRAVTAQRGR